MHPSVGIRLGVIKATPKATTFALSEICNGCSHHTGTHSSTLRLIEKNVKSSIIRVN
jgi:hypothetical protein